jgi:hypothetical protein
MKLRIRTPTADSWPELQDLFGEKAHATAVGACTATTFARAGFKVVARCDPPRPIMRIDLKRARNAVNQ